MRAIMSLNEVLQLAAMLRRFYLDERPVCRRQGVPSRPAAPKHGHYVYVLSVGLLDPG